MTPRWTPISGNVEEGTAIVRNEQHPGDGVHRLLVQRGAVQVVALERVSASYFKRQEAVARAAGHTAEADSHLDRIAAVERLGGGAQSPPDIAAEVAKGP